MTTWIPIAYGTPPHNPPTAIDFETSSDPVLVFADRPRVATHRRDIDTGAERWVTDCSEGWTLDNVQFWTPVDNPNGE